MLKVPTPRAHDRVQFLQLCKVFCDNDVEACLHCVARSRNWSPLAFTTCTVSASMAIVLRPNLRLHSNFCPRSTPNHPPLSHPLFRPRLCQHTSHTFANPIRTAPPIENVLQLHKQAAETAASSRYDHERAHLRKFALCVCSGLVPAVGSGSSGEAVALERL